MKQFIFLNNDEHAMALTLATAELLIGNCPFCGITVNTELIRDDYSHEVLVQSGMCQFCQDEFYDEHKTFIYKVGGLDVYVKCGTVVAIVPLENVSHKWIGKHFQDVRANNSRVITL